MINFFTFKWGSKYDASYPNRLYGSLLRHCSEAFTFTCITDDLTGLRTGINTIDYNTFDPFDYPKDRVFTREKLVLFKEFNKGRNCWIDLDILIHNDITDLVTRELEKPTFIWNWWGWDDNPNRMRGYGNGQSCFINSSFVAWQDDMGEPIFDALYNKQKEAFYTYISLDKYLFYQHWHKKHLDFWERGLWYNYNFDKVKFTKQESHRGCLFNTSHLKLYKDRPEAYELHEAEGWAKQLWESYDN